MRSYNLCEGGYTLGIAFGTLLIAGLLLVSTSIAQIPPPSGGGGSSGGGGGWIVNATATNANGVVSQEWTWIVTYSGVVVNLGQPIQGKNNIWALTIGLDGKIYGGTGEGGTLFVYNPINNMSEQIGVVLSEDAVYSLATDEKGLIYGGTAWNSKFFVYDPLNKSITYLGQPITNGGIICSLAAIGSDIYGSTCDGGDSIYVGSHLFVYNSTARIFIDLGQPVAGERGSKISIGKDGKVYGGTSPNGYLFAYDTLSKEFTIIDKPVQGEGTAFPIITGKDGKIYFSLNESLYVFDPAKSKIDNLLELGRFIPVSGEFFWSLTSGLDGNIYGGTAPSGYLFKYNPSDHSISFIQPLVTETRIRALTAGIDGKIYGGTGWGAYLFYYEPPQLGSISGMKFNDSNGDGVKEANEIGLANWTIVLMNITGATIANEMTDANGNYSFTNLSAGNYTIGEVLKSGWRQTTPPEGNYGITITSAGEDVTGVDFGNTLVARPERNSISGFKINDTNGNGKWDTGEKGISNWTIRLIGIIGKGKKEKVIRKETLTDATGFYKFDNLSAGRYFVIEKLKKGFVATSPPVKRIRLVQSKNSMNNNFTNIPVQSRDKKDDKRDIDDYEAINRDIDKYKEDKFVFG
jgi:hypothetical protein